MTWWCNFYNKGDTIIKIFEPIEVEYIETEAPIIEYIKDPEMEVEYVETEGEIIEFIEPAVIEVEVIPNEQINIDYDA